MTHPKRKPGRPAKQRQTKPSRPLAMPGGVTVVTRLDPETVAKLDKLASDQSISRAGLIREMIERIDQPS